MLLQLHVTQVQVTVSNPHLMTPCVVVAVGVEGNSLVLAHFVRVCRGLSMHEKGALSAGHFFTP